MMLAIFEPVTTPPQLLQYTNDFESGFNPTGFDWLSLFTVLSENVVHVDQL